MRPGKRRRNLASRVLLVLAVLLSACVLTAFATATAAIVWRVMAGY